MSGDLQPAKLPEGYGAGGGYVEGIHPMGHGDLYGVIAGGDGAACQPIALGAQHDGKLWLGGKGGVVNADRAVAQRHGSGLEAQRVELGAAVFRPVGRAGADLRPRHLKHGAHAHPHRAAAQRVAAGGGDEHGIHVQRGSAAEDSAHVRSEEHTSEL